MLQDFDVWSVVYGMRLSENGMVCARARQMKAHVQSKKQVHMLAEEKKAKTQKKSDEGDEVVGFGEHAPSRP